jgi:hypothetical protein
MQRQALLELGFPSCVESARSHDDTAVTCVSAGSAVGRFIIRAASILEPPNSPSPDGGFAEYPALASREAFN